MPVPLYLVRSADLIGLKASQPWLDHSSFAAKAHTAVLAPDGSAAYYGVDESLSVWSLGRASTMLPPRTYRLATPVDDATQRRLALGWRLGAYRYRRYKSDTLPALAQLEAPEPVEVAAMTLARNLINTPAADLPPLALAEAVQAVARQYNAACNVMTGAALEQEYPLIHAVGRASAAPPCLIDLIWGEASAPKLTLVGKGVTFDSGGLNLKTGTSMNLMKKDMGGAAWVLALAQLIMQAQLPVRLRVLIPAAENAVGGAAFRPGDVLKSRKGTTIEIGDTDAEGRLLLADALWEGSRENPSLMIDEATLTGAQRVALGTDLPGFFTNKKSLAEALMIASAAADDPLWELPLFAGYRNQLDSPIADICNVGGGGYAGAITAALFLQEFVAASVPWVHVDFMAWNLRDLPGRPIGGEVQGLRAIWAAVEPVLFDTPCT
ncbi:MAG: leucyl aminopeptidase family protein [Holosporales bacterium]